MFSTIAIASTLAGLAAAAPVARSSEKVIVPTYTATHFKTAHFEGSCGWTNRTNQYIASIATNSTTDKVNEFCGQTINVTSVWTGESVLAQVVDECKDCSASYLNLSRVAFEVIYPTTKDNFTATYDFVQGEDAFYVPALPSSSSPKAAAKPTSAADKYDDEEEQETSTSSSKSTPSSTSSSKKVEYTPSSSSTYTPTTSSSEDKPEYTPSSSSKKVVEAEYTPTSSSSKYTPAYTPSSSSSKAPAYTPKAQSSGQYSGTATYYLQNGNAGACGNYNSDSAYIVALYSGIFAGGAHCGQTVTLTNRNTGKTMTASIQDECPSCGGNGNIDLSQGLFQALGNGADGVFPISFSIN